LKTQIDNQTDQVNLDQMSDKAKDRIAKLTSSSKFRKVNKKKQYRPDAKLAEADSRFSELMETGKRPPVDMFGHVVDAEAMQNYESSSDEEIEAPIPPGLLPTVESDSEEVRTSEKTLRLALSDLPWRKLTAQDIYGIIAKACEKKADDLESVVVFLSRYGQSHPPEEDGPPPEGLDPAALTEVWRQREKADMKRYFAICTFKDADTADKLCRALSGCEIEDTGAFFDISAVPDGMEFGDFQVRDSANSIRDDWQMPQVETPWMNKSKRTEEWDAPK
jgi:hypothetical protein